MVLVVRRWEELFGWGTYDGFGEDGEGGDDTADLELELVGIRRWRAEIGGWRMANDE